VASSVRDSEIDRGSILPKFAGQEVEIRVETVDGAKIKTDYIEVNQDKDGDGLSDFYEQSADYKLPVVYSDGTTWLDASLREVPYEFQPGATTMLVVRN